MATAADPYTEQQLQEVWSWVHNQDRCVTTQAVSLEMGLPRTVAGELLKALPKHNPKSNETRSYEVTCCCLIEEAPNKSVVKLIKSTVSSDDENMSLPDGTIYSIALSKTESFETAHERDMVTLRENMEKLDPSLHCFEVQPVQAVERNAEQKRRVADVTKTTSSSTKMRKTTTAKDFFNNIESKNKKKESKSVSASDKKPAAKKDSKNPETSKKDTASKKKKNPFEAAKKASKETDENGKKKKKSASSTIILSDSDDDDESVVEPSPRKKSKKTDEEKENVGNADDFVGDEEEDDDFLAQEEERKKRQAKQELQDQQAKREREQKLQKRAERPKHDKKPQEPTERKRKRRKKLVDKTTMDASGYLHTEKVTVWEDIPTDEEDEVEVKTKSLKPSKPIKKNMKQAGLMGFFTKKK